MRRTILASFAIVLAFAGMAVASTRDEYKAEVEPICKKNQEASKTILTGVKQLVKSDKLKQAGQRFTKAAAALETAQKQLAAVPQPEADAAKLTKWLSSIKGEVSLMKRIGTKFKQGDKKKGSSLVVTLERNAEDANNLVFAFQFKECKINPSKYK